MRRGESTAAATRIATRSDRGCAVLVNGWPLQQAGDPEPGGGIDDVHEAVAVAVMGLMDKLRGGRNHAGGDLDLLVLTSVGAQSGQRRETVLGAFPDGERAWLVAASAAGAKRNPAWYHNLAAHPDRAQIAVHGKSFPVTVTQLNGAGRDEAWQRIAAAQPRYAGFAQQTSRLIPVLRLTAS
jgi:deazaflavin-dependent oxidoreductase (nitroreductase family)